MKNMVQGYVRGVGVHSLTESATQTPRPPPPQGKNSLYTRPADSSQPPPPPTYLIFALFAAELLPVHAQRVKQECCEGLR